MKTDFAMGQVLTLITIGAMICKEFLIHNYVNKKDHYDQPTWLTVWAGLNVCCVYTDLYRS